MKVLMILGSRNPNGQTARAAEAFLEGIASEGGQAEKAFLPQMNIERCHQCEDNGWGTCRTDGKCKVEDDFSHLVDKIRQADAVVFATPVYFGDLSESMRAFLDRLRRICSHETGKDRIANKPAIGICVAGGRGGGAPSCSASMEKIVRTCDFDLVDMVLARRQNLEMKLPILKATGKWLASIIK